VRIGGPAALGSLIFTFYNLADAFWVGRLPLDDAGAALAGIQVSWPFVWLLISFIGGFAGAAASAFVAQYTGAGRPREANLALNQLVLLSAVGSVLLGLLGFAITPGVLSLLVGQGAVASAASLYLQVIFLGRYRLGQGAVASAASLYLQVIFLGLPTMVLPGLFSQAYIATGDGVTPLLVNGACTVLNMVVDPFLVLGWGPFPRLGILGAAYATVAAQAISTAIFLLLFARSRGALHLRWNDLRPRWDWIMRSLRVGLPAGLGQSATAFGFVVMTWVIGHVPNAETALAGYGVGDRLLGIFLILSEGLQSGLTAMIGQALGAGLIERARSVLRKGLFVLVAVLSVQAVVLVLIRRPLVALFAPGNAAVIDVGVRFTLAFALSLPFFGTFFAAVAVYRAAGRNVPAMILETVRLWGMRIPLAYILAYPLGMGASGAWWGMALSNILAGLLAVVFLRRRTWQHTVIEPAVGSSLPHPGGTRANPDEP
jgi:putative MATE family efflux protein